MTTLQIRMSSRVSTRMLDEAWGKMYDRLLVRCKQYGKEISYVPEHFTTKVCGACAYVHKAIGGRKLFVCPKCRIVTDRDAEAARKILLLWMYCRCQE